MTHAIPANAKNSDVERLVAEYVRLKTHRKMLLEHWFDGKTFQELAADYHLTLTAVKKVIYNEGDSILLMLKE